MEVSAIKFWQDLTHTKTNGLEEHQFEEPAMFALRNCLRGFHAQPCVPVDVMLDELRYTHCTIKSVFGHGSHAGLPLQRTVDELAALTLSPQSEPMTLNAVLHEGKPFTLHNRRL